MNQAEYERGSDIMSNYDAEILAKLNEISWILMALLCIVAFLFGRALMLWWLDVP